MGLLRRSFGGLRPPGFLFFPPSEKEASFFWRFRAFLARAGGRVCRLEIYLRRLFGSRLVDYFFFGLVFAQDVLPDPQVKLAFLRAAFV